MGHLKNRVQQHRPQSDEKKINKDMQDLRAENRLLRKQVSQLRRELQKMPDIEPEEEAKPLAHVLKCPKCASENVKSAVLPVGTINRCQSCDEKWKS